VSYDPPPPATPAPTDVPATPTEAATTSDPLGPPAQAVTREAEARRPTETVLAIADARAAGAWAEAYFKQVHQARTIKLVSSWQELVATIVAYDRITHLVLLTHSGGGGLECGPANEIVNKTPGQLADELLKGKVGAIERVTFDGCSIGSMPTALLDFKTKLRVPLVDAWTWTHWLDGWKQFLFGDTTGWTVDDVLAKSAGQFEKAAPFLPDRAEGKTISATAQAELLLRQGKFTLVAEVFIDLIPDGTFAKLMADPSFQFDASHQLPRSAALAAKQELLTPKQAADFEEKVRFTTPLHWVVLRA
jgi:hypothetical protein